MSFPHTTQRLLLLAGLAIAPSIGLAQAPSPTSTNQQAVSQRIAALQAKLAITPDQQAAWDSFAQAMSENAATTDQLFAQRAAGAAQMTAVQNMHSYADIARAYADNTAKLASAFDTLYARLTDQQKQAADVLFRQTPPTKHR